MSSESAAPPSITSVSEPSPASIEAADDGPLEFVRESKALYERHLVFDKATDPATASPRAFRRLLPLGA
jgi:hypothetical protein